ncbi:DUF5994 family protein [Streptomyces gossypiisoli]|uniref:DUF5994 family protein n=1 Tax=Streptomyces gossypiisoli TaxID=2748864 RepID=UPI002F96527E
MPRAWGHITSVTVNGATWSAVPGRMLVFNQVVRLSRTVAASAPHTIVLLAPGRGAGTCWSSLRIRPRRPRNRSWPRRGVTSDPAHHGLPGESSGTHGQGGDDDRHTPTTSRPGRPAVASYDEEVPPACSAITRAVAVIGGPVFALAAAISRAAEGALVCGGITRRSQRPAV